MTAPWLRRAFPVLALVGALAFAIPLAVAGDDAPASAPAKTEATKTPSPIHSMLAWVGGQVTGSPERMCPSSEKGGAAWRAWYAGGKDVPLAGLRDAMVADGWTADRLIAFFGEMAKAHGDEKGCDGCPSAAKTDAAAKTGAAAKSGDCGSCPKAGECGESGACGKAGETGETGETGAAAKASGAAKAGGCRGCPESGECTPSRGCAKGECPEGCCKDGGECAGKDCAQKDCAKGEGCGPCPKGAAKKACEGSCPKEEAKPSETSDTTTGAEAGKSS